MKLVRNHSQVRMWAIVGCLVCQTVAAASPPGMNSGSESSVSEVSAKAMLGNYLKNQTDPFTGAFAYSVSIEGPPARNGTDPKLTLSYSSGGENSWCGVGWNLQIAYIERYTKDGVPVAWNNETTPAPKTEYDDSKGFLVNFFGKQGKIVSVGSGEYRTEIEGDFLRFTLDTVNNRWEVYDKAGNRYYFGKNTTSRMANSKTGWSQSQPKGTFHWALDEITTATGDLATITYVTDGIQTMIYPQKISYNSHINYNSFGGTLTGIHTIEFGTEARNDRRFSYRSGFRIEQTRRLTNIVCKVGTQAVRRYAISYEYSGSTKKSRLKTIKIYGNDDTSALPAQTFTYADKPASFEPTLVNWLDMNVPDASEKGWVAVSGVDMNYAVAQVTDLVDVDGDGLPDRVRRNRLRPYGNFLVQRNNLQADGTGRFTTDCNWGPTLNQDQPNDDTYSAINSTVTRFLDMDGDGRPDRVMDYKNFYTVGGTAYDRFILERNTGKGFSEVTWTGVDVQTTTGNGGLKAIENTGSVKMIDINGDGIPDRVMSMTQPQNYYDHLMVQLGTGSGFRPTRIFGPFASQGKTNYLAWGNVESDAVKFLDMNGDGLPDRVMLPTVNRATNNTELVQPENRTKFVIEFNNGYAFEEGDWTGVDPQAGYLPKPGGGTEYITGYAAMENLPYVGLSDMNGDGLPDRVMLMHSDHTKWYVQINNGSGFEPRQEFTNVVHQGTHDDDPNWYGIRGTAVNSPDPNHYTVSTLIDINGDGLVDRVLADYNAFTGASGSINGFRVGLNRGPVPDLMTNIDNGIGGSLAIQYKPSTAWDNRKNPTDNNSERLLPFIVQTVTSVSASDGVNAARTTGYEYEGGFYDSSRREFAGFCVAKVTDPSLRVQKYWFHQGGGRDEPGNGEFQDVGSFAKRGMPFRIETIGNDGLLYRAVINKIQQDALSSGRMFPYIYETVNLDYPGGGSTYKASATRFQFDNSTGNLRKKTELGEVTLALTTYTAASGTTGLTDTTAADTAYQQVDYAVILNNDKIKDHPSDVKLTSDDAGSRVIQETKFTYNDANGTTKDKKIRIDSDNDAIESYSYDSYGNRNLITDARGIQTKVTFDSTHQAFPTTTRLRVTAGADNDTVDHIRLTTYDSRSGLITDETDVMGIKVHNTYDKFFRLTQVDKGVSPGAEPSVWVEKCDYSLGVISSGNAATYVRVRLNNGANGSDGLDTWLYADGFGRWIQTRTLAEDASKFRVVTTAYDERGEAFLTTWPRLETGSAFTKPPVTPTLVPSSFTLYDPAGRVSQTRQRVDATFAASGAFTSKTNPDPTGDTDSRLAAKTWEYKNGSELWWIVATDEDGKVRRYRLDGFGRTNRIEEVDGQSTYATTLNYDLAGNLTEIVNQNSEHIYYGYDDAGRVVAMADPHLGLWKYKRDAAGRLREQTDARGQKVTFEFTASLSRLGTKKTYDAASQLVSTATYTYDSSDDGNYTVYKGLLYKVTDGEGLEKNGYDTRGRLSKTTRHLIVNNQDYTTIYGYNDGDKVTSIQYPNSGPTINYDYHPSGSLYRVHRGTYYYYTANATKFDEFGHVTEFTFGNNKTTTRSYFDKSKRLQTISCPSVLSRDYHYSAAADVTYISGTSVTYDNLHRVKAYTGLSGNYAYDAIGSITHSIEGGGSDYGYGTSRKQAVKSAFGNTYLYDSCGNMIVRGTQALAYDPENRLARLSQGGSLIVEFGYGADGERLWKRKNQTELQVWIGKVYEEKQGKTLFHVFADSERICTFEPGSVLAGGSGGSGTHVGYYYHQDHLGSTSALTDSAGAQLEVNVWYPFGRTQTASPQASFQVSSRFTGQILDAETGLYYYNARYYDPQLGRFIQPDDVIPDLSNPQSYNRYSYCLNNPLRYTDPTGHWGQEAADWWQARVGAGANYISASPSHWIWNGTVGTINSIVGGVADPLRLGTSAGTVSGDPNASAGQIAIATVQEAGRTVALVPVGAAIGKGTSALVNSVAGTAEREAVVEVAAQVGTGGMRIRVNPNTGELGGININGINGNSLASKRLQHGYEIFKKSDQDVVKTGVSGQPLRQSGASPRSTPQMNKWNRAEGQGTYDARVVTQQPDRAAVLQWERQNAARLRQEGNSMSKHKRP